MAEYSTILIIAYIASVAASLVFFSGYLAGFQSKEFSLFSLLPLLACLLAGPAWAVVARREMNVPPDEPEDKNVPVGTTIHMEQAATDGPMLLEDCTALLVSPKGGGSVRLDKVRAVTMAEFIRTGWQVNFKVSEMAGRELKDGFRTAFSKGKITELTDALAQAKLIVKAEGVPTKSLYPLSRMLDHLQPVPLPRNWKGWYR